MVTGVRHNEQPGDLEAGEGAHVTVCQEDFSKVSVDAYPTVPAPQPALTGSRAPAGSTGSRAPAGSTGSRAPAGSTGSRAPAGSTGSRAPAGSTGSRAPAGYTGSRAPAGFTGPRTSAEASGPLLVLGTVPLVNVLQLESRIREGVSSSPAPRRQFIHYYTHLPPLLRAPVPQETHPDSITFLITSPISVTPFGSFPRRY
ncbi:uncharacterized protein LOC135572548 [Oncorhynchus nerka]|uniref:uncharacterized protein LOC135572548 n=1 Tax=Oncorhynchus nerka TaxID=8023 RepID=UPI0031B894B8